MGDFVIVHGDTVDFAADYKGINFLGPTTKPMVASGQTTINGKKVTVVSDLTGFTLACDYTTPTHSIPGKGTFMINGVADDQMTKKDTDGKKKVIIKGSQFDSIFIMSKPAEMPASPKPIPDAPGIYKGKGTFKNDGNDIVTFS